MKSPLKTVGIVLAVCAALAAGFGAYRVGGAWTTIAALTLGIIVALVICTVRTPADVENVFDRHKKRSIILATVVGGVFLIACCRLPFLAPFYEAVVARFAGADLFEYYTAQLSLTFISISVMSVLSDKSVIIYWANVSEDRLIRPTFHCFAAYTYYSIGATVGAGLGVFLNDPCVFILFFAANVAVLILLTVSMIDVYYGRDTKKKKLAKSLNPYNSDRLAYEEKILGLEQNLLRAADEKDVMFLREVYELCMEYPGKFDTDIGNEAVTVMVSTLDAQTVGPFLRAFDRRICEALSVFPLATDYMALHGCVPFAYDTTIWTTLDSKRALGFQEQVSVTADGYSSPNAILFARVLMHRLTLEYNIYAAYFIGYQLRKGGEVDPKQYFISDNYVNTVYEPKTADGNPLPTERFQEVMRYMQRQPGYNTMLFTTLIHLMNRVVRDGINWFASEQFSALPYIPFWVNENFAGYDADALTRLSEIYEA